MADRSKIEWTDASWNPVRARNRHTGQVGWFCKHVSEACRNCYAEGFNLRLGTRLPYHPGNFADIEIFLDENLLLQPLRWKRPRKIFVGSMTDIFADFVTDEMLDKIFAVAALCPQHTFQFLTKRPARMRRYFAGISNDDGRTWLEGKEWRSALIEGEAQALYGKLHRGEDPSLWLAVHTPLPNVWLGTTVEDQPTADERIPDLLATLALVHFVSGEPLLAGVNIDPYLNRMVESVDFPSYPAWTRGMHPSIDWVICGGESGPNARPMHPDWARSLRDQCAAAGVPFFFKQWGEWADTADWPSELQESYELEGKADGNNVRVGKRRAGRLLDGVEHNAFPEVA